MGEVTVNSLALTATASKVSNSLTDDVEEAVCVALGIKSTRHHSALLNLRLTAQEDIVGLIFQTVAKNYKRWDCAKNWDRSQKNWRLPRLKLDIDKRNTSKEVRLERQIAAACKRANRTDWANQLPVASGWIAPHSDKRRAIDLVHNCGDRHFELIELKIGSDTPLYAAVEIISYGCIWLLARATPQSLMSPILEANCIDLRVMAPVAYYSSYDLSELEALLDYWCRSLGAAQGVIMTFAFLVLDQRLDPELSVDDDTLLAALNCRNSWRQG